jgi:hypothetical protein
MLHGPKYNGSGGVSIGFVQGGLMHELTPVLDGLAWIAQALSPLAALASIFWIGFQWYHSKPMKERRARRRNKR